MMILAYDTETTGLPDWRAPSDMPSQPHLVQLALIVALPTGRVIETINVLIRPAGWVISEEVSKIHGITHQRAMDEGIEEADAVAMFTRRQGPDVLTIAHNLNFDRRIMRIAMLRSGASKAQIEDRERWPSHCTMQQATPLVNAPPTEKMIAAGFKKAKSANLGECVQHFFKEDLVGAHDAMVDAQACLRIFFAMNPTGAVA